MTVRFIGLRFLIIFETSYIENSTDESDLHVFSVRTEGSLLLLLTREHCFEKKSSKSSVFSLKSVMNCHCATEVECRVSFYYLERSLILTSTTLDLFSCLIVYQKGVNNTLAWIPQLYFLNVLEEMEIY